MDGWTDFAEETCDWSPALPAAVAAWLEERMAERLRRPGIIAFSTTGPQSAPTAGGFEWHA